MMAGLDTNILVYAVGTSTLPGDIAKTVRVRKLLADLLGRGPVVIPTQALGELLTVLLRFGDSREDAARRVKLIAEGALVAGTSPEVFWRALETCTRFRLQMWDSLILEACAAAGCSLLLSEDMQNGLEAGSVTVINPFAEPLHPRLAAALAEP